MMLQVKDNINCVITVPAYFNFNQRRETVKAAQLAGINVLKILNEPTSAAIAYSYNNGNRDVSLDNQMIFVFDLGGGTFDCTIMRVTNDNGEQNFTVVATYGDTHLGGVDIDNALATKALEYLKSEYEGLYNEYYDVEGKKRNNLMNKLKCSAENGKESYSIGKSGSIYFTGVTDDDGDDVYYKITEEDWKEVTDDIVHKCMMTVEETLRRGKTEEGRVMTKDDITKVLLVGGSSRIPEVTEAVEKYFGKNKTIVNDRVERQTAVGMGAAIEAFRISSQIKPYGIHEVCPMPLSITALDESNREVLYPLIDSSEPVPTTITKRFQTNTDNQNIMTFKIQDLPKMQAGEVEIEIQLEYDELSMVRISATVMKPQGVKTDGNAEVSFSLNGSSTDEIKEYSCKCIEVPSLATQSILTTSIMPAHFNQELNGVVMIPDSMVMKFGRVNEEESTKIPSVIAKRKKTFFNLFSLFNGGELYGNEALNTNANYGLVYPIQRGIVTEEKNSWDDVYQLIKYCYRRSGIDPQTCPILLTDCVKNSKRNREKIASILFDKMKVPQLYIINSAALALYSYENKCSGIVIDIGEDVTQIVPIINYSVCECASKMNVGMKDFVTAMKEQLSLDKYSNKECEEMVTHVCFVKNSRDYEDNMIVRYDMADGTVIEVGEQRYSVPEILFTQPRVKRVRGGLPGRRCYGIHEEVKSILKNVKQYKDSLAYNIILTGKGIKIDRLRERLESELNNFKRELCVDTFRILVNDDEDLAWKGANNFFTILSRYRLWLTKEEYERNEPSYVHKKF